MDYSGVENLDCIKQDEVNCLKDIELPTTYISVFFFILPFSSLF